MPLSLLRLSLLEQIRGRRHGAASKAGAVDCFPKNPEQRACAAAGGAFGGRRRVERSKLGRAATSGSRGASGEVQIYA